jgi:hypothetical protein
VNYDILFAATKCEMLTSQSYEDLLIECGYHSICYENEEMKVNNMIIFIAHMQYSHIDDLETTLFTITHEVNLDSTHDYYYLTIKDKVYEVLQNWHLGEFIKKLLN